MILRSILHSYQTELYGVPYIRLDVSTNSQINKISLLVYIFPNANKSLSNAGGLINWNTGYKAQNKTDCFDMKES